MSATEGRWRGAQKAIGDSHVSGDDEGVFVIHAVLLRTGRVLVFSGHAETVHYLATSFVWDPATARTTAIPVDFPTGTDIFCCHHVVLEDGRVLTVGGAAADPNHGTGIRDICVFDPLGLNWEKIGDLSEARWYPTAVTLPDGRVVVFSGRLEQDPAAAVGGVPRGVAQTVEVLSPPFRGPGFTTATVTGGTKALAIYPGLHLVKGGKIFYTSTTWRYEPSFGVGTPINTFSFRMTGATAGTWTDEGITPTVREREEGTSILLPPAQDGKILLIGGCRAVGHADTFTGLTGTSRPRSAEILSTQGATPAWSNAGTGQMAFPRINASAVLLPDATVLIVGGHENHKWCPPTPPSIPRTAGEPATFTNPHHPDFTTPRFAGRSRYSQRAEIYDPATNTVRTVAAMRDPRTYHSACLLLPDGRVFCAGGVDPRSSEVNPAGGVVVLNRKTMEFYEPPYFFKGRRPTLTSARRAGGPPDEIKYGDDFMIETPQAATIDKVVLMRPGAMTHHTDSEQRYVPLDFVREGSRLRATVLNDATVLPPGFYMLWIVDRQKRPCRRALLLRVSARGCSIRGTTCAFTRAEVESRIAAAGVARFPGAFTVVMESFRPDELGVTTAAPTPVQLAALAPTVTYTRLDGSTIPDVSAEVESMTPQDAALPPALRQNFSFSYATVFTSTRAFDGVAAASTLPMRVTASKLGFSAVLDCGLSLALIERVLVPLRRVAGDRFVSPQTVQVVEECAASEATATTAFVRAVRDGLVRGELAAQFDEVDVEA